MSTMENSTVKFGTKTPKSFKETRYKTNATKMYSKSVDDQIPMKDVKLCENSVNEKCCNNMLDLSNQESYEVLCLHEKIAQLPNDLTELEISNDDSSEFSQLLSLLKNLEKLQIQNNVPKSLPSGIEEPQNLHTLNLSHNQLTELPENLSDLKNLETLNLSYNKLNDLPLSYKQLQKLKHLDLSNNTFNAIPKCVVEGIGTLRVLDISVNPNIKMNIIPYSKYLEKFYAKNNEICCKFPDWTLTPKFFNLKEINFDNTKFDMYSFVGKEGSLCITSLTMINSNLSNLVLEMMIENMINLEKINLGNEDQFSTKSGNIFNNIPIQALKNPGEITEINFRDTSLPSVPSTINQLCNLKKLDIGLNCILWLPDEICNLEKLEYLFVDGNGLFTLPENIGNMKSLQEIRVQNNSLVRLPKTFNKLKNLKFADFYNNNFEECPDVLFEITSLQGLNFEQNYFSTDSIKIGEKSYSDLYNCYLPYIETNLTNLFDLRSTGVKKQPSIGSDITSIDWNNCLSSEENSGSNDGCRSSESEGNWDDSVNSDDDFDPENIKDINVKGKIKSYVYQEPEGFCPADLHLKRVKAEVASMRTYGSLSAVKVEPGQFDDA